MSATPTRIDWEAPLADAAPPLAEGNRVLESIGRQEGLRALLAFSDLHEQIRNRRPPGALADWDLFQTERFVLDEVLQLICDRVQALTHADGVVVALAEGSAMVCRATAGPLSIRRGVPLNSNSALLRECQESGKILRCDDAETDSRIALDFARLVAARSTVLVPLRGRTERLGVLQAFSAAPWSFTDHDVRCFELFGELVLAALRPQDQDRRFHWLSGIAGEVLHAQPDSKPDLAPLTQPVVIPVAAAEICVPESAADHQQDHKPALAAEQEPFGEEAPAEGASEEASWEKESAAEQIPPKRLPVVLPWRTITVPASSRPGLSVVIGLVAVAALFSVGVWWGTQVHDKTPTAATLTIRTVPTMPTDLAPARVSNTVPAAATGAPAAGLSLASDNLLEPAPAASGAALVPIPDTKLAALPKITGVRHWSSSMGSTVVIDMQDQVPYEVHRLMSPERIYFDLHDTALVPDLNGKTMEVGDVSLTKVRVAQPVAGVTRIVLDTRDGSNFSVSMESNPYRLVVELRDNMKSLAAVHSPPAAPKPAPAAALTATMQPLPARTGKFRIMLDPGHGGWDLGTVGRKGLLEKDLVLDVTQRLGKLLQARLGSEVMFTRSGDEYLPLDQRADFANQAQADLFVSVHANYSTLANARGVETYYTNLFSAPGSKEAEKHADGTFPKPTPVSLSASSLHEKIEESRHLAASVQRCLYATLAAKSPDIRDRGIKDASFAVLTGTTMPAILTEISFVSSPADEHNLQTESYRQQIAEALYKGIARYEESAPHAKVAKLMPGTTGR